MESMTVKEKIIDKALELGFHQVGFGTVRRFNELESVMMQRKRLEFEPEDIEVRLNPEKHFPGGRSFICLARSYDLAHNSGLADSVVKVASAMPEDYHMSVRSGLEALLEWISTLTGCRGKSFVDLEGLNDRAVALTCGIGYRGKSGNVISPYQGTHFNIGYLIVDLDLEEEAFHAGNCGSCTACVQACPTGAIRGDYTVDADKCLSYLTQKKALEPGEESLIQDCIYGCDICQLVCPKNTVFEWREHSVFKASDLLDLSNRAFKKNYGNRDFSWRGASIIKRNILLIQKNRSHA